MSALRLSHRHRRVIELSQQPAMVSEPLKEQFRDKELSRKQFEVLGIGAVSVV